MLAVLGDPSASQTHLMSAQPYIHERQGPGEAGLKGERARLVQTLEERGVAYYP